MNTLKRGLLVVLEGLDRAGKTTQCRMLVDTLQKRGMKASLIRFPNRQAAPLGPVIQTYLEKKVDMTPQAAHLLFVADRWQAQAEMKQKLVAGETLIVDRYSYSGTAFAMAKGLDKNWCWAAEKGLLRPDLVCFLSVPPETAAKRGGFGLERHDDPLFQKQVKSLYQQILPADTLFIDANQPPEHVQAQLEKAVLPPPSGPAGRAGPLRFLE